ncbi:NAL12 protein, partial [Atractosteus spatula]|nr:NAL12 protein [Atractosteus spatula]
MSCADDQLCSCLFVCRMRYCKLTERGCEDLASALQSQHSSLRELDLSYSDLGDSGVKLLSAALRDPNCKLTTLKMWRCELTKRCCEDLASALQSQHSSLTEMDLSLNSLGDSGVKLLSAALRDPKCKLTTLKCQKGQTMEWQESENRPIRSAKAGVSPGSAVQEMPYRNLCPQAMDRSARMSWCRLTEKCCEDLASALQSQHSSLRQLDLNHNNLGDSGVKLLSAALRDPNCKLTTLK